MRILAPKTDMAKKNRILPYLAKRFLRCRAEQVYIGRDFKGPRMRGLLAATVLAVFTVAGFGQSSSKPDISKLPVGSLSNNIYTNDSLGVTYKFPSGWIATSDPKDSARPNYGKPDQREARCSRTLALIRAPSKSEGRFSAFASFLVIDPSCVSGVGFPQSLDKHQAQKVADRIIKIFRNSPYLSQFGVEITVFAADGRVNVELAGGLIVNAVEGRPAAATEPLKVNTSFVVTEANGYWFAWAYVADEPSTEELKREVKVTFKDVAATGGDSAPLATPLVSR